jgi:hypothetical protein
MRLALVRGVGGPSDRIFSVVSAARVAFPRRLSQAFADASMLEVSDEHLLVFDRISSDTELCAFATGSSQLTLLRALMIHMDFMDQRRVGGHVPRPPAGAGVAAAASILSFVYNEGITDFIDTIVIVLKATGLEFCVSLEAPFRDVAFVTEGGQYGAMTRTSSTCSAIPCWCPAGREMIVRGSIFPSRK